jgi:hypothetical protein
MSEREVPKIPAGIIAPEQLEAISGGDCSVNDYIAALQQAKTAYESLVDFTSYVIERVAK